eukprot:scaffold9519_cov128-Isochrysis_galbana.AAC.4
MRARVRGSVQRACNLQLANFAAPPPTATDPDIGPGRRIPRLSVCPLAPIVGGRALPQKGIQWL